MNNNLRNFLSFSSLFLLVFSINSAANTPYFNNNNIAAFPLLPRISLSGWIGTQPLGLGDTMIPLIGNRDGDLYADLQGKTARDHAWLGGAGLGYRQVINCSDILGAYVFVDRNITADKNRFTVLNPGLESLGTEWDFRVNGYFPMGSKKTFENSAFADELGLPGIFFRRHQQFNTLFNFYEEIGPGADAEIGYIFPCFHRLAIYGGGYYYKPEDVQQLKGAEARAELPLSRYATLLVNDTYDNYNHNTFELGVRVSAGGLTASPPTACDVHNRLLDPVARNLGALSTGDGIPSFHVRDNGTTVLERDNIWFFTQGSGSVFNPAAGENNCTAENPCGPNQFTQSTINTIDTIARNANFYLNTNPPGNPYPLTGQLTINNGQNIYGRTLDYTMEAFGDARPVLTGGGLVLQGNNFVQAIQLFEGFSGLQNGVEATNANNITLDNDYIGSNATQNLGDYRVAVFLTNSNAVITNSILNAFPHNFAVGISSTGGSVLVINSQINTLAEGPGAVTSIGISGLGSIVTVLGGSINVAADNSTSLGTGIASVGGSVFVDSVQINVNPVISRIIGNAQATGFDLSSGAVATITNSIINVGAQAVGTFLGPPNAIAYGVKTSGGSVANVFNNTFNVSAFSEFGNASAFAYSAGAGTTINTSNNTGVIQAIAPNGTAIAARIDPAGGGTVNGNSDSFIIIP